MAYNHSENRSAAPSPLRAKMEPTGHGGTPSEALRVDSGITSMLSASSPDLFIERFCMTGGNSPICYLKAYHTNLYLSADAEKVREAIDEGESC